MRAFGVSGIGKLFGRRASLQPLHHLATSCISFASSSFLQAKGRTDTLFDTLVELIIFILCRHAIYHISSHHSMMASSSRPSLWLKSRASSSWPSAFFATLALSAQVSVGAISRRAPCFRLSIPLPRHHPPAPTWMSENHSMLSYRYHFFVSTTIHFTPLS